MTLKQELIDYSNDCINGKIISGKKHKQACKRFLKDIEREVNDPLFFWSWNEYEAQKIVNWFTNLRHSKGIIAGQPIHLTTWQKFIACQLYGWLDSQGNRRFKKALIIVGRKNAKSQLLAGILLYEISYISVKYNELIESYCAGIKKRQSKIIFNECKLMLKKSKLKNKFKLTVVKIEHIKTGSYIEPLSKEDGKTGDGENPNTTCLDEYHLHEDTGFYDMHDTGAKARRNPLLLIITTAGFDLNKPCYTQEYKYCSDILNENIDIENDSYFVDILEMDIGDKLSIDNISKANPIVCSYEVGVQGILDSLKIANEIPEKMTAFLTKTCNTWLQAKDNGYMDMSKLKKCEVKNMPWEILKGNSVYIGFDMSAKIDLTSVAFIIPLMVAGVAKYYCFSHSFVPSTEKLLERERTDKAPYTAWERQGFITVTDSPIVDQEKVITYFKKFCEDKGLIIKTLCFDPSNASKLMMDLANQGYEVVEVYQSQKSLNESTVGFREQILCENVIYEHNPVLNFSMANAITKQLNGLIKIDKDATTKRIDPVDAMLGAFKLAQYHEFQLDLNKYLSDDYLDRLYGG